MTLNRVLDSTEQAEELGQQAACRTAGCHDFTDPVIVRQGAHLLHGSMEVAVIFCRRCGAYIHLGWTQEPLL